MPCHEWTVREWMKYEIKPNFHIHIIEMPDEIPGGWYQQIMSAEAFLSRGINYWHKHYYASNRKERFRFTRYNLEDEAVRKTTALACSQRYIPPKMYRYPDLWAFWRVIQYDHKANNIKDFIS